jgi:acetolactate synthase-1/2/3 large subunit
MTVSAIVVDLLEEAGVRRCYTVPGESFLEILDAVEQHAALSLISARHESGASFMAEADAKLTGVPAVAMATRGVGASNLAIGVHTARQDSTPMVVLLGQVETTFLGREAFQEVDLPDFYRQITKWSATVHRADRLPEFVARALHIATTGRPGPVMLALPADILGEDVGSPERRLSAASRASPAPTSQEVQELARRIVGAERPVVIAGGGTRDAREELISFVEAFGVGVYTSFRRQDHFPNDHPNYLGHLTLGTPPATLKALEEADLVLVVGCRLSEVTTQSYTLPRPGQAVIQVDIDPDVVGAVVPVELGVVAGARQTLAALVSLAPSSGTERDWHEAHGAYLESSAIPESRAENGVDPARAVAAMRGVLPTDTVLTNDAGNFSAFLHRYWRYTHPKTQLAPTSGAMGYGVPAAVAAKTAAPDRRVVAVAGDGGFMMTGQELETAVRYGLNILVIVFKNGMHGTIAMHQMRSVGRTAGTEIGQIDLATYASSLGAQGWSVSDEVDLDEVLRESLEAEGPALVEVVTDPDLITPTARLSELGKAASG